MQRENSFVIDQPNEPLNAGILNAIGSTWSIKRWNINNDFEEKCRNHKSRIGCESWI